MPEDKKATSVVEQMKDKANIVQQISDAGYEIVPKGKSGAKVVKSEAPAFDFDIEDDSPITGKDLKKILAFISKNQAHTQGLIEESRVSMQGTLAEREKKAVNVQANKIYAEAVKAGMSDEDFQNKVYPEMVNLYKDGDDLSNVYSRACKLAEVANPLAKVVETKETETNDDGTPKIEPTLKPTGTAKADSSAPSPKKLDADISGKTTSEIAAAALDKTLNEVGNPKFKADEDAL